MKHLLSLFIVCFLFTGLASCSDENIETENQTQELSFSLKAPNGEFLASDINELNNKLSGNENSEIEVLNIEYFDVREKTKLAALLEYEIDGEIHKTIMMRNIENLKFDKGTVIKFSNQNSKTNKASFGGDIYISCSGGSCCYPSGSYNPNTGTITTSCKCDSGNNSQCVMKISEQAPGGGSPGGGQQQ